MRRGIYILLILIVIVAAFSAFLLKANLRYDLEIEELETASLFDFLSKEDTWSKVAKQNL